MELQEIMDQQVFAVAGNTLNGEKYAAQIKNGLAEQGYTVYGVGKELSSFNDISEDIDIIDLCIRPEAGLALMQQSRKTCKCVVLQPGADSPELVAWLEAHHVPYVHNCLLVGMRTYPRKAT